MAIEKELLQAMNLLSQGKEEGFNTFYSYTYNYVYSRAKLIMKNEEDALDLTQETFIQAYKGIGSLEDANNVYAWLGGIVYRQGMRIFRKKKELLVNDEGEGIFEDVVSQDISGNPEDAAQQKATSEIVMGMIEELPELQKAAVLAFYYDNMKIDDIADIFECSANTIKSRLNYAKKTLKDKVEAHEKANRYKLCSLSPAVLLLAFKSLFATDGYAMAKTSAQNVYNASCGAVGLSAGTLSLSETGTAAVTATDVTTSGTAATAGTVTGDVSASSTAGAAAGASIVTKTGLSLGAKIGIGLSTLAVIGTVATGTIIHINNSKDTAPSVNKESSSTNTDETISETVKTEITDISKLTPEEVLLNIYGTDIHLTSTKDEVVEIGKEAGWVFYVEQSYIIANFNNAQIYFRLKDGADASAPKEVYEIEFDENIDWNEVQIYGLDVKNYIDNYKFNTNFYENITEEIRIDIFQYNFSISVNGDHTLTKVPDDEFREEAYGYDKADFTVYGKDAYVNEVIRAIYSCEEFMSLDFFYKEEILSYIFQQLKTFEFGETVICSHLMDGGLLYQLECEDGSLYAIDIKHNFTGETVYIRDEHDTIATIAEAEWDAIHDNNYDRVADYTALYNCMVSTCNNLKSEGLINEYNIDGYKLKIQTAKGIEYEYTFGNPHRSEIMNRIFENLNTPHEEYSARKE